VKRQLKLLSNLVHRTAGISALCMLAFNAQAVTQNYVVNLEVDSTQTKLEIKTDTSQLGNCNNIRKAPLFTIPPDIKNGCTHVSEGDRANINIQLTGNPHCSDGRWELEGVYLGGYNSAAKPDDWGDLPPVVVNDFSADQVSGKVGTRVPNQPNPKRHIRVEDNPTASYFIWYKVVAECKNNAGDVTDGPIETDPRIKNDG